MAVEFPTCGLMVYRIMRQAWYFSSPVGIIILSSHAFSVRFLYCECSEEDSGEVFVDIFVVEARCDEFCVLT